MTSREVKNNIYSVGAIDWDRRLFDELIPLPDGTSYNAYLIKDEKVALIDAVDPTKEKDLLSNLKGLGIEKIDYLISQHAEQDHSGAIPKVLEVYPEAKVVANEKCKGMLKDLLSLPEEKFLVIGDEEKLSLGKRSLEFIFAPWVHWPETFLTYLREEKLLFTCDLFGSHLATSDLYAIDEAKVYEAAKRYYAEIMMPFRSHIQRHLARLHNLPIEIIAPSHGPIYHRPNFILGAYQDWVSDEVKNEVVLFYISMHGSTQKMAEYLISALMRRGIKVLPFNLTKTDIGELAISLVDCGTILVGSPAVLGGLHPQVLYAVYLANALRPKTKFLSFFGSYGWGCRVLDILKEMTNNLKVEMIPPVLIKGYPKEKDFSLLEGLADEILKRHRESQIIKCGG